MSDIKTRRLTLVWTRAALLQAVCQAFRDGDIVRVPVEFYCRDYWRRAVWAGVEAVVLRQGQPTGINGLGSALATTPEALAATESAWEAMKGGQR